MKKIIFILMLSIASFAHADAPITKYKTTYQGTAYWPSGDAACAAYKSLLPPTTQGPNYGYIGLPDRTGGCYYGASDKYLNYYVDLVQVCFDNSSPDTSKPLADQCTTPPPLCTAGKTYTTTLYAGSATPIVPTSSGGCAITIKEVVRCYSNPSSADPTKRFCELVVTETGALAPQGVEPTGSLPAPDAKPADVPKFNPAQGQGCPAGTTNLGTDSAGGSICGGSGTAPTTPSKTEVKQPVNTVTNSDGSTTKTEVTTRSNSDGSTTTTTRTTTTGADGKVTTSEGSVTGALSSGGTGKNDSSDDKKDDFCLKNPNLNVCKNSEVSAGGCSAGVDTTSCAGDAIQCAILRQQKKEYCENQAPNPLRTLGEQIIAGDDPLKTSFPSVGNSTTFNVATQLNDAGFLGGGSCFPDKTINVGQFSMVIPFSQACQYMLPFRYMVMLMAAFFSLQILSRGVFGK